MTTTLPTMAVRNALAYVGLTGSFLSHTSITTRVEASRYVAFNFDDERRRSTGRYYELTEAGDKVADRGTLRKVLAEATRLGFKVAAPRGRGNKPGYIALMDDTTGQTAFISSGRRLFINRLMRDGGTLLAYDARTGAVA